MKKIKIISVIFILALALGQSYGQNTKNYVSNSTKEKRVEKRSERKELRKLEGYKVSSVSMKSFANDFENASDVQWKRTQDYDIAAFKQKGHEIKAFYDADGQLVGTTQFKTIGDLPDRGQKILSEKYGDYKIGQILYFNNNTINRTPMMLWGIEISDQSNFFVELSNSDHKMVVYVDPGGSVSLFKKL